MKFGGMEQPNNGERAKQEQLPEIDQGELVMQGVLADYYEKIMKLKEDMIHAGPSEKEALEKEIMDLQKEMEKADKLVSEGKPFPRNDNVYDISENMVPDQSDDIEKAA